MKNIPTRFVCKGADNYTFHGIAGNETTVIPNVASIPHHNNMRSSSIMVLNTGQYDRVFCNSSSHIKSWNILDHKNTLGEYVYKLKMNYYFLMIISLLS